MHLAIKLLIATLPKSFYLLMCVCVCVFMALITAQVLCARSQDLVFGWLADWCRIFSSGRHVALAYAARKIPGEVLVSLHASVGYCAIASYFSCDTARRISTAHSQSPRMFQFMKRETIPPGAVSLRRTYFVMQQRKKYRINANILQSSRDCIVA